MKKTINKGDNMIKYPYRNKKYRKGYRGENET